MLGLGSLLVGGLTGCRSEVPPPVVERGLLEPGSFKATWKLAIDPAAYGELDRLFLRDDLLFAYTDTNVVQVISSGGGQTRFVATDVVGPRDRLWPPVVIDVGDRLGTSIDEVICFPSGTEYLLYTMDGQEIQETPIGNPITSRTSADNGLLFVGVAGSVNGLVVRIDPTRKIAPVLNEVLLSGAVASKPVLYGNLVYVADDSGRVWAIADPNQQAWPRPYFATADSITADLRVDEYGLYVAGTDLQLYCLDRLTGRLKWSYFAEVPLYRPPYPTSEYVFQPVQGKGVVCLSKAEGQTVGRDPIWTAAGARDVLAQDEDNIYMVDNDGFIVAYEKATGEELFRSQRNDFTIFARNTTGSRIFAGKPDGQIVAIDPVLRRGEVGELVYHPLTPAAPLASTRD